MPFLFWKSIQHGGERPLVIIDVEERRNFWYDTFIFTIKAGVGDGILY